MKRIFFLPLLPSPNVSRTGKLQLRMVLYSSLLSSASVESEFDASTDEQREFQGRLMQYAKLNPTRTFALGQLWQEQEEKGQRCPPKGMIHEAHRAFSLAADVCWVEGRGRVVRGRDLSKRCRRTAATTGS